jgi:hypothetical protein
LDSRGISRPVSEGSVTLWLVKYTVIVFSECGTNTRLALVAKSFHYLIKSIHVE